MPEGVNGQAATASTVSKKRFDAPETPLTGKGQHHGGNSNVIKIKVQISHHHSPLDQITITTIPEIKPASPDKA